MGQKIHPLGFRVGITKKHQSQWFARFNKYKYSQSILEDRMIRETLSKLFPELLNPILNKNNSGKKRDEEISITPRITQIKIERGLIPYEIGIQIHAENCDLLKSAIDNLKVKRELIVKLQKTRRYLLNLKLKLKDALGEGLPNNSSNKLSDLNIDQEPLTQNSSSLNSQLSLKIKSGRNKVIPSIGRKTNSSTSIVGKEGKGNGENKNSARFSGKSSRPFKFRTKLTKQELRRQRLIKKRLKKRQFIRSRYRQLILNGLFIKKSGNKIIQTLCLSPKKLSTRGLRNGMAFGKSFSKNQNGLRTSSLTNPNLRKKKNEGKSAGGFSFKISQSKSFSDKISTVGKLKNFKNTFGSRIKKKFVTLFIQKMNKNFLSHLKVLLMNYTPKENTVLVNGSLSSAKQKNSLPLGYSKQWSLTRLNLLKNQPIYKLNRMIVVLEQKLLVKLESLRKEFIAFGSISAQSSESLGYFQILNFLKNLKELVNKLKREQKLQISITKNSMAKKINSTIISGGSFNSGAKVTSTLGEGLTPANKILKSTGKALAFPNMNISAQHHFDKIAETVLQKKLNNIDDECRKVKLIEYVKDIVKKHRTENIYFYLSTMSDAGKDLRKIKQFTKRHADFLFGLNLNNFSSQTALEKSDTEPALNSKNEVLHAKINERVSKVLEKSSKKTNFEKTLQDIFLEQIEKQRTMCLDNLRLTPKISIKFYSVNKKTLEQKASIVSESVVDALEKRKAFRKVIKDAKETLMRTPGVKGVKIQVAGRLNGAEIARTEWVRAGRVPLQTLRANLDYSYRTASTIYGIIGVRVWIFKGYAKLLTK